MHRRWSFIALAVVAVASIAGAGHAQTQDGGGCAPPSPHPGEWTSYGHDLNNSRSQPDAGGITPDTVSDWSASVVFNASAAGGRGFFQSTPVIAGGCVYAATDGGNVYALNAETFELVWTHRFFVAQTRLGGVITGAVTVADGLAFVSVSDAGKPFVAALDALTGAPVWQQQIDDRAGSFINSSPVAFEDMLFIGFSGDEYVPEARGGYAILDRATGAILEKRYTIPDEDFAQGYWGGSVWSTAVYDATSRSLFAGTGNPASHEREHELTNALVRIDADPESTSFGDIVDSYKGTVEQYYPGLDEQPACDNAPDVEYGDAWSLTCLQLDLDFGASPNLFTDANGKLVLGALQKSGVYHAVYADTMDRAWTAVVGTPCFICNSSSSAAAEGRIFLAGGMPGQVVALDATTGGYEWMVPLADLVHYQSVSHSPGITYATDLYGTLTIIDSRTGVPIAKRDMSQDAGVSVGGVGSGGVAIARSKLYVAAGGALIAYGPGDLT